MKTPIWKWLPLVAGLMLCAPAAVLAAGPEAIPGSESGSRLAANDRQVPRCLLYTGSHLVPARSTRRRANRKCVSAPGRGYTRADIDRTGAIDVAGALSRLGP